MTLKQRIDELEKRVRELEQAPKYYPPVYEPRPITPVNPVTGMRCNSCGGFHGNLPCPMFTPTC